MMVSMFFDLASIVLGLISWIIPVTKGNKKYKMKNHSSISLSCCIMALLLQIFELKHLVDIEDLSAVLDTVNARSVAAIVLVVVTMVLNVLASKRGH